MNASKTLPPLPDHLSTDPRSPHYVAAVFEHDVGIRFNDRERFDVSEYCLSEGWVRVPAGRTLDRKGNPLLIKLKGKVEAFYRGDGGDGGDGGEGGEGGEGGGAGADGGIGRNGGNGGGDEPRA